MTTKSKDNKYGPNSTEAARNLWRKLTKTDQPGPLVSKQQAIGNAGERCAQEYLTQRELTLVARNYRCRYGEIDLIMRDGDCLVFIEVKQRRHARFGSPLEMVSDSKQLKLRRAAEYYIAQNTISCHQAMRFDVVGITSGGASQSIQWVQNAF